MKILILNSDSPNNRGDRAILTGNIKLIKGLFPESEIWSLSEFKERDEKWFEINFYKIPVQSISIKDTLILLNESRKFDYIFWGGGEILKDYTNKLALYYWVIKIFSIWIFNKNIYGAFQGIGPTKFWLSKKAITFIVNRTKIFFVRDKESGDKLENWGVKTKIVRSIDPAIMDEPGDIKKETYKVLECNFQIDKKVVENFVGIGPRNWFHYKKSGWIPYKYKKMFIKREQPESHNTKHMIKNMALICDHIINTHNTNIIFFPMHTSSSENDLAVSKKIHAQMQNKDKVFFISQDNLPPNQYLSLVSKSKAFIGVRLHSTILSTIGNVPSMVFYYVDKGRIYFEQIKQTKFSYAIDELLKDKMLPTFYTQVDELINNQKKYKLELTKQINELQKELIEDFSIIKNEKK